MKNIVTKFFSVILILLIMLNLTGCSNVLGVEELAYVVAIGLDTIEDNNLELTLQFATASNSGDSSGSSMQSTENSISTVKCVSIDSGISLINSHISKKINLSHCQEIIISEELAKKGIERYLDTLVNNTELTNDASIVISKCRAKEYIENVNPVFEGLLSQYYKASLKTNKYTSYSTNINLASFYCLLKDTYFQPHATIGDILKKSDESSEEEENSISSSVNANFSSGNYNIDDKNPIQTIGFAAFKNDKFVGEFTGLDSICFLLLTNNLNEAILTIPSPFEENSYIDLSITSNKKTKCSVDINDLTPTIHVDVYLTGFGQNMNETISYGDEKSIKKIHESAENFMKESILNFLNKTSKEYCSDICGFGRFAVKNYLTMEEWKNVNWLEKYKNSTFDVNVSFNVKAGNVFSKT